MAVANHNCSLVEEISDTEESNSVSYTTKGEPVLPLASNTTLRNRMTQLVSFLANRADGHRNFKYFLLHGLVLVPVQQTLMATGFFDVEEMLKNIPNSRLQGLIFYNQIICYRFITTNADTFFTAFGKYLDVLYLDALDSQSADLRQLLELS
jgi:hypothetical protein